MARGRRVTGKPIQVTPPLLAREIAMNKNKVAHERDTKKFEEEQKYYNAELLKIVNKALVAGRAALGDEEQLAIVFNKYNKEWTGICSRVNKISKVIKLNNQAFRYQVSMIAKKADIKNKIEEVMKSETPDKATPNE